MRLIIYITLLACLTYSCNNNSADKKVVRDFDSINHAIDSSSPVAITMQQLEQLRFVQPDAWNKVRKADIVIGAFITDIDTIKMKFTSFYEKAGTSHVDDPLYSRQFFIDQRKGHAIKSKIEKMVNELTDISLTEASKRRLEEFMQVTALKDFPTSYFQNVPPVAALTMLTKWRNNADDLRTIIFKEYADLVKAHP